jgi:hypothetical protein
MTKAILFVAALIGASALISMTTGANNMDEIKFDLGKNIHAVAKASGAPRFQVGKYGKRISYDLDSIPDEIPMRFSRPQFEFASAGVWPWSHNSRLENGSATLRLIVPERLVAPPSWMRREQFYLEVAAL